ncbi:MAG: Flp pilus assembly protein CpaB [Actinomycetota bacterium]
MHALILNRRRTSLWGVVTVLAAVATGLALYSYLSYLKAQVPIAGKLVPVVVAAIDIEPGSVLTPAMLTVKDHPSKYLPEAAIHTKDAATGQTAAMPILRGEAVTLRKLSTTGGLSSVVPAGMRAYSLATASESSLSFLPKTGDRIDVIVTFPAEVLGQATSITVLRNKEVASVGNGPQNASGKVADRLKLEGGSQEGVSITLYVTPEEAEHLALAEALGRIKVILAPSRATDDAPPGPVTPKQIGTL